MERTPSAPGTGTDDSENAALLRRILAAVEKDKRRGRLEIVIAIVLSLATLASTWCGYQARQWGGVQGSSQSNADTAERQAAESTIVGLQLRTQDGLRMLEYWKALREKDQQTADTMLAHMRPALRAGIEAAIRDGALEKANVPGPLERAEYVLREEQEAQEHRKKAADLRATAQTAGQVGGNYVLLTLIFAAVLFFGGIGGTFSDRRVRVALACMAIGLFAAGLVVMLTLSPYRG